MGAGGKGEGELSIQNLTSYKCDRKSTKHHHMIHQYIHIICLPFLFNKLDQSIYDLRGTSAVDEVHDLCSFIGDVTVNRTLRPEWHKHQNAASVKQHVHKLWKLVTYFIGLILVTFIGDGDPLPCTPTSASNTDAFKYHAPSSKYWLHSTKVSRFTVWYFTGVLCTGKREWAMTRSLSSV